MQRLCWLWDLAAQIQPVAASHGSCLGQAVLPASHEEAAHFAGWRAVCRPWQDMRRGGCACPPGSCAPGKGGFFLYGSFAGV